MAKKNVKNVDVTVEAGKAKVTVVKKEKKVKVAVDTEKVDVTFNKEDENNKEFNLDTKNLDVTVKKEEGNTTVEVKSEKGFFKQVGKVISKVVLRRFKKN
jgi:hypothetical protein